MFLFSLCNGLLYLFHVPPSPYSVPIISPLCFKMPPQVLLWSSCLPHDSLCLLTFPHVQFCHHQSLFLLQFTSHVSPLTSSPHPDLPVSFSHSILTVLCHICFSPLFRTFRSLRLLGLSLLSTTGTDDTCTVFMTSEARTWHLIVSCSAFKLVIDQSFRSFELGNFINWDSTRCRDKRQQALCQLDISGLVTQEERLGSRTETHRVRCCLMVMVESPSSAGYREKWCSH